MKQLFKELELKSGAILKNRLLMAPMTTQSAYFDGRINQEIIDYYSLRSGDAGAIIVESCFIHNDGRGFPGAVGIDSDDKIPGLSRLADSIKHKGSKAIIQIYHAGRMAWPNLNGGANPIAPSPVAALRPNAPVPREMTQVQITDMIQLFVDATRRAILSGFNGVELHGANTFILQQFFSPHSNRRADMWGGSREKRLTFITEIVKAVCEVIDELAPADFILGYRFSPEELEEPGITFEDTMYLLNKLAEFRFDYFHFSMGTYDRTSILNRSSQEKLITQYHAMKSDKLAKIPIVGVGSILQKEDVQEALKLGYDLIAAGKAFLIDPDWVNSIKNNNEIITYADASNQDKLVIPDPLWSFMHYMIIDPQEEKKKHEKLKELQNIALSFTPGTYTVMASGHNKPIPMEVTFTTNRLSSIKVDDSGESEGLSDQVFEQIPKQIIAGQTLNIDAISGASVSSQGVIDGITEAVKLADGNIEVMKARPKPKVEWIDETVEKEVDVVVIGGGAAGIAAALRSSELGHSVTLIEKMSFLGGAISISGGNQVVTGSKLQKKCGVTDDNPEKFIEDFKANGDGSNDTELLTLFANKVGETTDWVNEYMDISYNLEEGLHYLPEYQVERELAYNGGGSGFAIDARKAIQESNVEVILDTRVLEIVTDNEGEIVGVEAQENIGRIYKLKAQSIILASGGYGNNKDLLNEELRDVLFYGPTSSTGDGIILTSSKDINAGVKNMSKGKIYPNGIEVSKGRAKSTIGGNLAVLKENAILINSDGVRVVDESTSNHDVLDIMLTQRDKMLYLLMPQEQFIKFREEISEGGISTSDLDRWVDNNGSEKPYCFKAESLQELASLARMDADVLVSTIEQFNKFVEKSRDLDFNRPPQFLRRKIENGPYYLIEQRPRFATTLGGLVVNSNLQVLDNEGKIINKLFASGEVVGGVMGSDSPSGANNAWALTSGKIAAEMSSKFIKE